MHRKVGPAFHTLERTVANMCCLVSYDITKDGYRIATLTLVKSAYRLGDTVNVMVTLNGGEARVLRVCLGTESNKKDANNFISM